jgi:hypothetical protein
VSFGAKAGELGLQRGVEAAFLAPNAVIDLQLLRLDGPAPVKPYSIDFSGERPDELCVVGFGCTDPECRKEPGRRTFFAARPDATGWDCSGTMPGRVGCMRGREMVMRRSAAGDTCTGDSGGAALRRHGDRWQVVAITSRAVADSILPCGDGGVYVRLSPERAWITRLLSSKPTE